MNPDNLKNGSENQEKKIEIIKQNHSLEDGQVFKDEAQQLTETNLEEANSIILPEDSDSLEELEELKQEVENINTESNLLLQQEYENILRQSMPIAGTREYQERQKAVIVDINNRSKNIQLDEFTYFEELDEYIDKNPLFTEEDKANANIALDRIKDRNQRIEKTAIEYINEINSDIKIKNLFRSYLMVSRLIGQKETSVTNLLNKESFENVIIKTKNTSDIFSLDIFKNRDIQEYLKKDFNPQEYNKYYKEFTEKRLLAENKDNIKKYIKIQSIINSKEWQEVWNNVA